MTATKENWQEEVMDVLSEVLVGLTPRDDQSLERQLFIAIHACRWACANNNCTDARLLLLRAELELHSRNADEDVRYSRIRTHVYSAGLVVEQFGQSQHPIAYDSVPPG